MGTQIVDTLHCSAPWHPGIAIGEWASSCNVLGQRSAAACSCRWGGGEPPGWLQRLPVQPTTNRLPPPCRSVFCKDMTPGRPLDPSALQRMLEAASWAPSHGRTDPWRFVVFQGPQGKEEERSVGGRQVLGVGGRGPTAAHGRKEEEVRKACQALRPVREGWTAGHSRVRRGESLRGTGTEVVGGGQAAAHGWVGRELMVGRARREAAIAHCPVLLSLSPTRLGGPGTGLCVSAVPGGGPMGSCRCRRGVCPWQALGQGGLPHRHLHAAAPAVQHPRWVVVGAGRAGRQQAGKGAPPWNRQPPPVPTQIYGMLCTLPAASVPLPP